MANAKKTIFGIGQLSLFYRCPGPLILQLFVSLLLFVALIDLNPFIDSRQELLLGDENCIINKLSIFH